MLLGFFCFHRFIQLLITTMSHYEPQCILSISQSAMCFRGFNKTELLNKKWPDFEKKVQKTPLSVLTYNLTIYWPSVNWWECLKSITLVLFNPWKQIVETNLVQHYYELESEYKKKYQRKSMNTSEPIFKQFENVSCAEFI